MLGLQALVVSERVEFCPRFEAESNGRGAESRRNTDLGAATISGGRPVKSPGEALVPAMSGGAVPEVIEDGRRNCGGRDV